MVSVEKPPHIFFEAKSIRINNILNRWQDQLTRSGISPRVFWPGDFGECLSLSCIMGDIPVKHHLWIPALYCDVTMSLKALVAEVSAPRNTSAQFSSANRTYIYTRR